MAKTRGELIVLYKVPLKIENLCYCDVVKIVIDIIDFIAFLIFTLRVGF